jgi:hypothetical protein
MQAQMETGGRHGWRREGGRDGDGREAGMEMGGRQGWRRQGGRDRNSLKIPTFLKSICKEIYGLLIKAELARGLKGRQRPEWTRSGDNLTGI